MVQLSRKKGSGPVLEWLEQDGCHSHKKPDNLFLNGNHLVLTMRKPDQITFSC
jgi:hypothetical protein